jgi:hypothetical protein
MQNLLAILKLGDAIERVGPKSPEKKAMHTHFAWLNFSTTSALGVMRGKSIR